MTESPESFLNGLETSRKLSFTQAQREAFYALVSHEKVFLHTEFSSGKTLLTCLFVAYCLERGQIGVVLAPNALHDTCASEFSRLTGRRAETVESLADLRLGINLLDPTRLTPTSRRLGAPPQVLVHTFPVNWTWPWEKPIARILFLCGTVPSNVGQVTYRDTFVPLNKFNIKPRPAPISTTARAAYQRVYGTGAGNNIHGGYSQSELDMLSGVDMFPGKYYRVVRSLRSNLDANQRTVVVSSRADTLTALAEIFSHLNIPFARVDSSTPPQTHANLVEQFNSGDIKVLLLGSRLRTRYSFPDCSRVILFDHDSSYSTCYRAMVKYWRFSIVDPVEVTMLYYPYTRDIKVVERFIEKATSSAQLASDFSWALLHPVGAYEDSHELVSDDGMVKYCEDSRKKFQVELDKKAAPVTVQGNGQHHPNAGTGNPPGFADQYAAQSSYGETREQFATRTACVSQLNAEYRANRIIVNQQRADYLRLSAEYTRPAIVSNGQYEEYLRLLSDQGNGQRNAQAGVRQQSSGSPLGYISSGLW